jgi:hypothetical protein
VPLSRACACAWRPARRTPSPMRIETQRGTGAGRVKAFCRARGDAVCKPWIFPSGPVTWLPFTHTWKMRLQRSMVSTSLACQQLDIRCRAPSFASATEKSRAAVVYPACPTARGRPLVAHHTSIDRCCASNDGRGGMVLLCQLPAYHILTESTPDMLNLSS